MGIMHTASSAVTAAKASAAMSAGNIKGGVADIKGNERNQSLYKMLGKSKSIASMAKEGIFSYPVIYSQGVISSGDKLPFSVAKHLELQYAAFTMIAMGLNPVMNDNSVRNHVLSFYSEESDEPEEIEVPCHHVTLKNTEPMTSEEAEELKDALLSSGFYEEYRSTHLTSTEADEDDVKEAKSEQILPKSIKVAKKLSDNQPTIIDVDLKMSNGQNITISLAIKCSPHLITSAESTLLFSRLAEDKPLFNLARLRSGEVTLIKDILLQMERAKEDRELYARLGRHPWFRNLVNRGGKRKIKGFFESIPFIRKLVTSGNNMDILPICSLIVTKDEVEKGMNRSWEYFKKNIQTWNGVMDKLMLLCWAVYDVDMDTVEFVYNGLPQSEVMLASQLEKSNKDAATTSMEIIRNLSRKV